MDEDLGDSDTDGVWAPETPREKTDFEAGTMTAEQSKFREAWEAEQAKKHREYNMEEDHDRRDERKISHLLPPRHNRDTESKSARSTFHGKAQSDYQGRSWMAPPAGARVEEEGEDHKCFTPKKCIHRYTGHTKGVQAIAFFPGYGHLLLSASMDGSVKIWDVNGGRGQRRTYQGHSAAVRDVQFSNDGKQFLSAGYDRFIRQWDTETGQCVATFTNRKMPYCAKYYPVDNNMFLCGCSDNRVVQYDARSGEVVQEYNHHLGPVNTVLFVDDNQRFVSTSDDKKVRVPACSLVIHVHMICVSSCARGARCSRACCLRPACSAWGVLLRALRGVCCRLAWSVLCALRVACGVLACRSRHVDSQRTDQKTHRICCCSI